MFVFIDETGDNGLDFTKSKSHFVTPAVLVNNKKEAHQRIIELKKRLKIQGSLKKYKNREQLLRELSREPFTYLILVVDKRGINPNSGLKYKKSFYKFLSGILYNNLYKSRKNLVVYPDKLIDPEYVDSLKKYIEDNHIVDLFHQGEIHFPEPGEQEEPLLEIPDMIANAFYHFYIGTTNINAPEILKDRIIGLINFPSEQVAPYTLDDEEEEEGFSKEIVDTAILRVKDFINKNKKSKEPVIQDQLNTLSLLLNTFLYHSKRKYLHAYEIVNYLNAGKTDKEVSEQYLRSNILGPLKTQGILISCTNEGYKIPRTKRELVAFFNLYSRQIAPMMDRLNIARDAIFSATNGELDMFSFEEFKYLKK